MRIHPKSQDLLKDISKELETCFTNVEVCPLNTWGDDDCKRKVFVDDSLSPKSVIANFHEKKINHLVQKNQDYFIQDLKRAAFIADQPEKYFEPGTVLIDTEGADNLTITINSREEKVMLIDKAMEFLKRVGNETAIQSAVSVIEELYMNAMIDAPKEANKLGITGRPTTCTFELSYNKKQLQIGCTDSHGSLDVGKLIARLNEVYEKGAGEAIRLDGDGGAGLGCFFLFEQCSTVIFGVKKGIHTKVSCLLPTNISSRKRNEIKKGLLGFEI